MANRNALTGGTDYGEEGLKPSDVNDTNNNLVTKLYSDNTGGSSTTQLSEVDLATFTISQNDLQDDFSIKIDAGYYFKGNTNTTTTTFRLYVNGSVVKTISNSIVFSYGSSITYLAKNLDSTAGNIIVKVTGELGSNGGTVTMACTGLSAVALNRSD